MSKHTPGPWNASGEWPNQLGIYADAVPVAMAWKGQSEAGGPPDYKIYPARPNTEEARANARLIAAAPELLKALEGMRWAFLKLYGCYPPPHGTGEKYFGAMQDCDAAIKKAKGEN